MAPAFQSAEGMKRWGRNAGEMGCGEPWTPGKVDIELKGTGTGEAKGY